MRWTAAEHPVPDDRELAFGDSTTPDAALERVDPRPPRRTAWAPGRPSAPRPPLVPRVGDPPHRASADRRTCHPPGRLRRPGDPGPAGRWTGLHGWSCAVRHGPSHPTPMVLFLDGCRWRRPCRPEAWRSAPTRRDCCWWRRHRWRPRWTACLGLGNSGRFRSLVALSPGCVAGSTCHGRPLPVTHGRGDRALPTHRWRASRRPTGWGIRSGG